MIGRRKLCAILGGAALLGIGYAAGAAETPMPRGYIIAEIDVTDPATYRTYADQVPAMVARHGGRYLVRGGRTLPAEGAAPAPRVAVLEFASLAAAEAYYRSADYQGILPIRQRASTGRLFLVEGLAP